MDLEKVRRNIDQFDFELINLLTNRFKLCQEIGRYKQKHNLEIQDSERELK